MTVYYTPRGEATSAAIGRTQVAAIELGRLADALKGDVVSGIMCEYDGPHCRETARDIRARVAEAHAALAEILASAGMLDALSYMPDDVPIFVGAADVHQRTPGGRR